MLITISTPNLCTEYKQLIEATFEQSTSTYVVFVGDGVYAPALKPKVRRSQTRIRDASGPGRDPLDNAIRRLLGP